VPSIRQCWWWKRWWWGRHSNTRLSEVGAAAVGPLNDVMGLGPARWPVTAWEPAAAVADDERLVLGVAGDAVVRPRSKISVPPFTNTAAMSASQASRRAASMVIVSPGVEQGASPARSGELFDVDRDEHLGPFPPADHGARVVGGGQLD